MKRTTFALSLLTLPALLGLLPAPARAQEGPVDYSVWNQLLGKYYDPTRGMNYKALKANDGPALKQLRQRMATVDVAALPKNDQFAYWINLYNISVVATVVEGYPVKSIRDLSTDPIIRLNVFKKDTIAIKGGKISLDTIENAKVREGFKDPRIHFAINCAAHSCPPIRPEAYVGTRIGGQLDDQVRKFMNGPFGAKFEKDGNSLTVNVTKIMDWFKDDFEKWGGGRAAFLRKYVPADKQKMIDAAKGDVDFEFAPYDWKLNDISK